MLLAFSSTALFADLVYEELLCGIATDALFIFTHARKDVAFFLL